MIEFERQRALLEFTSRVTGSGQRAAAVAASVQSWRLIRNPPMADI